MLLGILEKVRLDASEVTMHPGDALVLYSDGITDATAPSGELFGLERLLYAIRSGGQLSAEALCDAIFERARRFQATAPQFDDMAVLVVKATHT
jgi:sigma-B regulation protein RsbU (phosphoserine phosphatase)